MENRTPALLTLLFISAVLPAAAENASPELPVAVAQPAPPPLVRDFDCLGRLETGGDYAACRRNCLAPLDALLTQDWVTMLTHSSHRGACIARRNRSDWLDACDAEVPPEAVEAMCRLIQTRRVFAQDFIALDARAPQMRSEIDPYYEQAVQADTIAEVVAASEAIHGLALRFADGRLRYAAGRLRIDPLDTTAGARARAARAAIPSTPEWARRDRRPPTNPFDEIRVARPQEPRAPRTLAFTRQQDGVRPAPRPEPPAMSLADRAIWTVVGWMGALRAPPSAHRPAPTIEARATLPAAPHLGPQWAQLPVDNRLYVVPTTTELIAGQVHQFSDAGYGNCVFLESLREAATDAPRTTRRSAEYLRYLTSPDIATPARASPRPVITEITDADGHSHASHRGLSVDIAYFAMTLDDRPVDHASSEVAVNVEFKHSREAALAGNRRAPARAFPLTEDIYAFHPRPNAVLEHERVLKLDIPRTAAFMMMLESNPRLSVESIFLSTHLRRKFAHWLAQPINATMLLRTVPRATPESLEALRADILVVPYTDAVEDAQRHDDHFHVDVSIVDPRSSCALRPPILEARRR